MFRDTCVQQRTQSQAVPVLLVSPFCGDILRRTCHVTTQHSPRVSSGPCTNKLPRSQQLLFSCLMPCCAAGDGSAPYCPFVYDQLGMSCHVCYYTTSYKLRRSRSTLCGYDTVISCGTPCLPYSIYLDCCPKCLWSNYSAMSDTCSSSKI